MAKEGEADTGVAGMDEEMVEIGSMEFAMATVIAETEALDPATLEEVRKIDWPKWDLTIKAELKVLKKAGTWGVVERPRGEEYCCRKMGIAHQEGCGWEDRALQGLTRCQRIHTHLWHGLL